MRVKHGETLKLTASWICKKYFEGLIFREAHTLLKWTSLISYLKVCWLQGQRPAWWLWQYDERGPGSFDRGALRESTRGTTSHGEQLCLSSGLGVSLEESPSMGQQIISDLKTLKII